MIMTAVIGARGQVYQVGDLYTGPDGSQGIVYYVKSDGTGWVVALDDLPMQSKWGAASNVPNLPEYGIDSSTVYIYHPLLAIEDTAGFSNTMAISNYYNTAQNAALGIDVANGWYLPSAGQMAMLYAQLILIETPLLNAGGSTLFGGTFNDYWTSTELDTHQAWAINFTMPNPSQGSFIYSHSGELAPAYKGSIKRVRAVRSLPPPQNYYDTTLTYLWNTGNTEPYILVSPEHTTSYSVTVTNAYGCSDSDSVVIPVIENEPMSYYDTICQGSPYNNYGFTLAEAETSGIGDTVLVRFVETSGCVSEITLHLTLLPTDTVEIQRTTSDLFFVWNGVTYTEDGVYVQYFNNRYGCDSTVILTLTFNDGVDPNLELPEVTISPDCQDVEFSWVFNSDSAANAAAHYYVYYKPSLAGTFTCIDSFYSTDICYPEPCTYDISAIGSQVLVGCYAMCVADSNYNLTELSDSVCLDVFDCLDYRLPNVFTPNGDGVNDLFTPFLPYFGVTKVETEIYNRWGKRVFRTEDPDIRWDGTVEPTQQPASDGVFYYGCKLYVNTLAGEIYYLLNGSITLIR
jgi:gliding motility-associated-like protein